MSHSNASGSIDDATNRLVQNLALDMLLGAMRQAGVRVSPETRSGLQRLRELINRSPIDATRPGGLSSRPLAMVTALLPVLQHLLRQADGSTHARCEANDDASRWAPRDSLRTWSGFLENLADGMNLGNRYIAHALGHEIH